MDRALRAAAALLLVVLARPAAASQPAPEGFDRSVDPEKIALLCDPENFRLSLRYRADEASLDSAYPQRMVIGPQSLVAYFPNHAGEDQYLGGLVRYELCGPFVVRLQGDFINPNLAGEMGAISPFASVTILRTTGCSTPATNVAESALASATRSFPSGGNARPTTRPGSTLPIGRKPSGWRSTNGR